MSHENMPGYRPPDTLISTSPTGVNAEVTGRDLDIQKLMDIRENALTKITKITDRLNTDYYNKDNIAPEEDVTELEGWIDVAHQITWSLIRDLLAQQSLEIEKANTLIEDQAPVLSWFQKVTDFFRQIISQPHQSAETPRSPAADEDSLTSQELASAKEALAGLYSTLEDVFCRLPILGANTAIVRAILITSILFTLLPKASANAPAHSTDYNYTPPPAQVSEATFPGHLNTPLPPPFVNYSTPLFTSHLATSPPPSLPKQVRTQTEKAVQSEEIQAASPNYSAKKSLKEEETWTDYYVNGPKEEEEIIQNLWRDVHLNDSELQFDYFTLRPFPGIDKFAKAYPFLDPLQLAIANGFETVEGIPEGQSVFMPYSQWSETSRAFFGSYLSELRILYQKYVGDPSPELMQLCGENIDLLPIYPYISLPNDLLQGSSAYAITLSQDYPGQRGDYPYGIYVKLDPSTQGMPLSDIGHEFGHFYLGIDLENQLNQLSAEDLMSLGITDPNTLEQLTNQYFQLGHQVIDLMEFLVRRDLFGYEVAMDAWNNKTYLSLRTERGELLDVSAQSIIVREFFRDPNLIQKMIHLAQTQDSVQSDVN